MTFVCDFCNSEVGLKDSRCPNCGVTFSDIKCPHCSYRGDAKEFAQGCPICHSNVEMVVSSKPPQTPLFNKTIILAGLITISICLILLMLYGYL